MDVLKTMKRCADILGLREKEHRISVRLWAGVVITAIVIINVASFLKDKWEDLDYRLLSLKVVIYLFTCFFYFLIALFDWVNISPLLDLFREATIKIPYAISPRRKELFHALEGKVRTLNNWWCRLNGAYIAVSISAPIIIVTVKLVLLSFDLQELITDPLHAPFPIYYPQYLKRFKNHERLIEVLFYLTAYTMHCTPLIFIGACSTLVYVITLSAIVNVEYELKMLALSLEEMDDMNQEQKNYFKTVERVPNDDDVLRRFCIYIVRHHQQTYRKFDMVNRGVRWIAFTFCFISTLYTCLSVFAIVKQDQIILKLQEVVFLSVWIFGIYLYDVSGERVKTEHDNLRNAVYQCSWLDKPEWFKRSILIIMARAGRPFDIKPFGLFGFSLNGFATRMNAVYCYYNFLSNFK